MGFLPPRSPDGKAFVNSPALPPVYHFNPWLYNWRMLTLVLPGGSIKNKDWATKTSETVNVHHNIRPIYWNNWFDPRIKFDAKDKAGDVMDVMKDDSANIIAKSIGTLVASYVIQKIPSRIQKLILCGIPFNDLDDSDLEVIKSAVSMFPPERIICIQNENDPHGGYNKAKAFLHKINPEIKLISKPDDTHDYPYYSDFESFLNG